MISSESLSHDNLKVFPANALDVIVITRQKKLALTLTDETSENLCLRVFESKSYNVFANVLSDNNKKQKTGLIFDSSGSYLVSGKLI